MLQYLHIKNYAIIDSLKMEFDAGFQIMTGETGAGKSIILGAFSLILGQRADSTVLRDTDSKCVVESCFSEVPIHLKPMFLEEGLDWDPGETIIRREILPSGKSRAFINDTPVTLQVLKEVGQFLVDLHRQHDTRSIAEEEFQFSLIDAIASASSEVQFYSDTYKAWKTAKAELKTLIEKLENSKQELEFWKFHLEELIALKLEHPKELEELEVQHSALAHADAIREAFSTSIQQLSDDNGVIQLLQQATSELSKAAKYHANAETLSSRLDSSAIEIQDVLSDLERTLSDIDANPEQLEYLENRIGELRRALMKFRMESLEELIQHQAELESNISNVEFADDVIHEKQAAIQAIEVNLLKADIALLEKRKEGKQILEAHLNARLSDVGMPHAKFEVKIESLDQFQPKGKHQIEFQFAPNAGQKFAPLHQVGSGGELSRLMVCIKHAVAGAMHLPTLFFDEVDTGISGEIAGKTGGLIREMAVNHQIIAITHLPQMAAFGTAHAHIYKEVSDNQTFTRIKQLSAEERIIEIAKMLSGEHPTEGAIQNAKELLMCSSH